MTPIIRSIDLCVYVVVFCTLVSPGGREEGGGYILHMPITDALHLGMC